MTQKKEEELINPNMSLEEALAIKRDPSKLLDSYQPKQVERYWYEYWEKKKLFHANS